MHADNLFYFFPVMYRNRFNFTFLSSAADAGCLTDSLTFQKWQSCKTSKHSVLPTTLTFPPLLIKFGQLSRHEKMCPVTYIFNVKCPKSHYDVGTMYCDPAIISRAICATRLKREPTQGSKLMSSNLFHKVMCLKKHTHKASLSCREQLDREHCSTETNIFPPFFLSCLK